MGKAWFPSSRVSFKPYKFAIIIFKGLVISHALCNVPPYYELIVGKYLN